MPLCAYIKQYIKQISLQSIGIESYRGNLCCVYLAWKLHLGTDITCELKKSKL